MNEIVVLGNGFDLASGLKSSYSDFMETRINVVKKNYLVDFYSATKNITGFSSTKYLMGLRFSDSVVQDYYQKVQFKENEEIKDLTFWDVYLFYKHHYTDNDDEILWYDIESDINTFIIDGFPNNYKTLQKNVSIYFLNESLNPHSDRIPMVCSVLISYLREEDYSDKTTLDFLFDELRRFEGAFKKYIQNEAENANYDSNAINIANKIIKSKNSSIYVLNFNYTTPFVNQDEIIKVRNIHGKTTNEIIFGIDTKNITPKKEQYKFTKTYRLLTKNNNDHKDEFPLPDPNYLNRINFFGHSLSKADYSYFQSIFDYYNLYSSNVELVFACRPYGAYSPDDMQRHQADLVTKLLHDYSETLPNKAHGENLIHKLLVEKRLSIKVI